MHRSQSLAKYLSLIQTQLMNRAFTYQIQTERKHKLWHQSRTGLLNVELHDLLHTCLAARETINCSTTLYANNPPWPFAMFQATEDSVETL